MPTYIGWVPTAIGRLSFTQIGQRFEPKCSCVNTMFAQDFKALFGVQRIRTPGWRFEWLTRLWGKHRTTDLAYFLEPVASALPYPCGDKGKAAPKFRLIETQDGCLEGDVYFLNEWSFFQGRPAFNALDAVRDATIGVRSKSVMVNDLIRMRDNAKFRVASTWRYMKRRVESGKSTPRFGRARVQLLRTGECRIHIEAEDLSQWQELNSFAAWSRMPPTLALRFEAAMLEFAAMQVFIGIRNLAHKHYHHDSARSIYRPVTRIDGRSDRLWRRRTLEGLIRMCVSLRQMETAKSYRRALGVIAYADAFQRHMGGWSVSGSTMVAVSDKAEYDFGALKASIDASLKERELRDQNFRARMFFAFGTLITALTILLPTYRSRIEAKSLGTSLDQFPQGLGPELFTSFVSLLIAHPISSALAAIALGWSIDWGVANVSVARPIYHWNRWQSRSTDRLLAFIRDIVPGAQVSRWLVVAVCLFGSIGLIAIWLRVAQAVGIPVDVLSLLKGLLGFV